MESWREQVQGGGASVSNTLATVTDLIDIDDTYHVETTGYTGENSLRARTQMGVKSILEEFDIPDMAWRKVL